MAWIRIESSVARNRKFVKAGPAPSWLWLCGLAYCQEGLTDGFIPTEALHFLGVKNAAQLAAHLVKANLWEVVDGGWQVHDYLKHNKSAAAIDLIREEKRAAGARGGEASGEARRKQSAEADPKHPAKHPANPSTATATTTATAVAQVASQPRPQPIVARRRMDAAWEGPKLYVPQRVHTDFIAFRNHGGAERELLAWYAEVSDDWTTGAHAAQSPGADMIRFWKARYDERWPAVEPTRSGKPDTRPQWIQDAEARKRAQAAS